MALNVAAGYRSRIVAHGDEQTDQLLANPDNWRIHPMSQQLALAGVLEEVGWVQSIIVNKTTGRMIDGHLRALLADRAGQQTVPVTYVELSQEEEALVLATFDPLSALAGTDDEKLSALLAEIKSPNSDVSKLLDDLKAKLPGDPFDELVAGSSFEAPGTAFEIVVQVTDASVRDELVALLAEQGYECKARPLR